MVDSPQHEAPAQSGALRFSYVPALDGIRTLAVAAVVLYHLNPALAPGGMQGVTIFFVLSGFLITRLLLVELHNTGKIDFKAFWKRRLRRLVPAIFTVIVVTAALCTLLNHVMLTKMRPDIIPSALFVNNWWQIFNQQSYFNSVGDPSPLTHFWSLAIEMQFYLVWPVVLLIGIRGGRSRVGVRRFALALAVTSALEMALLYDPTADPSRVYYGTDTRAFSLLLGAWLAFLPLGRIDHKLTGMLRRSQGSGSGAARPAASSLATGITAFDLIGFTGFAGTLLLMAFTKGYSAFPYRGGIVLASVFAMMLIAGCMRPHGPLARLLGIKPLVWLGQRSYSIYLWHYPLLLLMNPASDITAKPWWVLALQVALVIAVAELCYRYIETPFRHGAAARLAAAVREDRSRVPAWCKRHAIALAGPLAVCLIALGGIMLVPKTSALSQTGADLLQEHGPSSKGDAPKPGDPSKLNTEGFPEGSYDITMIGDSVSLRAVNAFAQVFPHGHIDAAMNRQFSEGVDIYQEMLNQNLAGRIIVFALGTNGPIASQDLDRALDLAGSKRIVVFVNNRCARPWCEPNNQLLDSFAERHKNVRVVDWHGHSANRNELFDGDGIHLSNVGVTEYLTLIKDEVATYLPVHADDADDPRIAAAQQIVDSLRSAISASIKPGTIKEN